MWRLGWEWLVVLAIPIFLALILYPAVQKARNPKGPPGKRIPTELPVEANRVRHPAGLSIIAPPNWDQMRELVPDEPALFIAARGMPGRRLTSLISIERCDQPELAGFKQIEFRGDTAFEQTTIDRHDTFDDPASSHYDLYIDRGDQWWHVTFRTAAEMQELPPAIRAYIETIEFP